MDIPRPKAQSAERMFEALRRHNEGIVAAYDREEFHLRAPFWILHLPDGSEIKVARFSYRGPLMMFTSFMATTESMDHFLIAPESVVLSVRTEEMRSFEGRYAPPEFLDPNGEESH